MSDIFPLYLCHRMTLLFNSGSGPLIWLWPFETFFKSCPQTPNHKEALKIQKSSCMTTNEPQSSERNVAAVSTLTVKANKLSNDHWMSTKLTQNQRRRQTFHSCVFYPLTVALPFTRCHLWPCAVSHDRYLAQNQTLLDVSDLYSFYICKLCRHLLRNN